MYNRLRFTEKSVLEERRFLDVDGGVVRKSLGSLEHMISWK